MSDYALTNCRVIDCVTPGIQENRTILIRQGKISRIGQNAEVNVPQGYKVLDLGNQYVMPGLINAHMHLFGSGKPMKAMSGGAAQKRLIGMLHTKPGQKILDGMVKEHALTAFYSGVTTIRAVGDLLYSDIRLRDLLEAGKVQGPRMMVSGPAISVTGGHGAGSFASISDSPWEARKLVRRNVQAQADFIKICVTGGVTDSRKVGQAGRLEMTLEEISAVCEEAHKIGYMVAAHAESKEGVRLALQGGADTIEHGSTLDREMMELFLNNPRSLRGYSGLIPTLYPAVAICKLRPEDTLMSAVSVENSGIVMEGMVIGMQQAAEAGISIGMGTDSSCPFVTPYNTWRELEYTVRYAGLSPEEAIWNATRGNAGILGIDHLTGTLEAGKASDLIVLKQNPLENVRALSDISMVMRGEILIEQPKVKKIPEVDQLLDTI